VEAVREEEVKLRGVGFVKEKCFFCGYGRTLRRDAFLVVCRVLSAKVVGATSSEGILILQMQTSTAEPGEVIEPADDVDVVVVNRFLSQRVVLEIQHGQLLVDKQVLRQVFELTVGQVSNRRQFVRRLYRSHKCRYYWPAYT